MYIEPIKPFTFMVISALMGLFPLTIICFIWWVIILINNANVGK